MLQLLTLPNPHATLHDNLIGLTMLLVILSSAITISLAVRTWRNRKWDPQYRVTPWWRRR
jgi:hypothetical protein